MNPEPLTKDEIAGLNYAAKNGFLNEDTAEELIKNPSAARSYLDQEPNTKND